MDSMQQHTIQIFMWAWYPESAKIHQKVSGGFWRIQDMSNIYTGGFWWIQDTSILCVTKLVDFGGFRILSSKNTQGVRVKGTISSRSQETFNRAWNQCLSLTWTRRIFIYLFFLFIYLLTKNQQRSSRQLQDGIDKSYDINKISPK